MAASHLKSSLSVLHNNKQTWANPELSIGEFCGIVKGKFSYWVAQGPAQEAYEAIRTDIQEILNSTCEPVRCSSAIVFDIYMVGRTPAAAIPLIMFSCKYAKSRKQAVSAVRNSGVLNRCPGIEVGHWDYPPHILNHKPLSEDCELWGMNSCPESSYCVRQPILDFDAPPHITSLKLSKCEFVGSTKPSWGAATIGSVVQYGDKVFYLAPEHFFSQHEDLGPTDSDSHSEGNNSECDFGGLSDDDVTADEDPDFMSQFSVSPACSDVGSDFDSESIYSEDESEGGSMPESPSRPIEEGLHDRGRDPSYFSLPSAEFWSSQQLVNSPVAASRELDYALIEASPVDPLIANLPVLSRDNVAQVRPGIVDVTTVTGSGHHLRGRLSGRPSYVRVPYSGKFQEAFTVQFHGPLLPGDSGSVVVDAVTGLIYGHIFLGSVESRVGYIMPAVNVLNHLETTLESGKLLHVCPKTLKPVIAESRNAIMVHSLPPNSDQSDGIAPSTLNHSSDTSEGSTSISRMFTSQNFFENSASRTGRILGWIYALPGEQAAMQALFDGLHPLSLNTLLASNTTDLRRMGVQHVVSECFPSGMVATVPVSHIRHFYYFAFQQGLKSKQISLPWTRGNAGIVERMPGRRITNEVKDDISLSSSPGASPVLLEYRVSLGLSILERVEIGRLIFDEIYDTDSSHPREPYAVGTLYKHIIYKGTFYRHAICNRIIYNHTICKHTICNLKFSADLIQTNKSDHHDLQALFLQIAERFPNVQSVVSSNTVSLLPYQPYMNGESLQRRIIIIPGPVREQLRLLHMRLRLQEREVYLLREKGSFYRGFVHIGTILFLLALEQKNSPTGSHFQAAPRPRHEPAGKHGRVQGEIEKDMCQPEEVPPY